MKKVLLGCGGVTVLLVIAGGALGYFYVYRPARQYIASFAQLEEVPKLNAQVRNKAAFTPPASGELTPELVDRFMKTQDALRARMGARLEELDAKYKAFDKARGDSTAPPVREIFEGLKDLGTLVVQAKRAQVEALNEQGFSVAEYEWTRNTMYQALGMPIKEGLQDVIQEVSGRGGPSMNESFEQAMPDAPEVNRKLVEPHKDKLGESMALAFFGL
jgi:hypothetical protein